MVVGVQCVDRTRHLTKGRVIACANTEVKLCSSPEPMSHPGARDTERAREREVERKREREIIVFRAAPLRRSEGRHYDGSGSFAGRSFRDAATVSHRDSSGAFLGESYGAQGLTTTHRDAARGFVGTSYAQSDRLVVHRGANGELLGTSYRKGETTIEHRGASNEYLGTTYEAGIPQHPMTSQDASRKESR